jgi:TatD DNase family protein
MSGKKRRDIPRFQTPIIETHCHLDYLDQEELAATLSRAQEAGIERIVTIAVSPDNLEKVRSLTAAADNIWGTQGIHPHGADNWSQEVEAQVREGLAGERIVAVGEIGLDYYYDNAERSAQIEAFERQLQIAAEHDLPVVIHSREADEDTRDILRNHCASLSRKGVIHSFTSSLALAEYCLGEGFKLGFNGITTFRQAENVREVVRATPADQIVLETDAPYLTPVPYRGKPNSPCYLPFIAECVAQVKDMEIETLLQRAYDNSLELFFPQA